MFGRKSPTSDAPDHDTIDKLVAASDELRRVAAELQGVVASLRAVENVKPGRLIENDQ